MAPSAGKGLNKTGTYYHTHQYPQQQHPNHQQPQQPPHHRHGDDARLKQGVAYFSPPSEEPLAGLPRPGQPGSSSTPLSVAAIASHTHSHGHGGYASFTPGAGIGQTSGDEDDATSPSSQGRGYDQTPGPGSVGASAEEGKGHEGIPINTGSKKRKAAPGSRGVANLTPEQLAKKRANGE